MKDKLLIVCGPTATGKTSLALFLAKNFDGELISADSRQVYTGMDIGTGKEWGDSPIWGYDLVEPIQSFSVSEFSKFANKTIEDILNRNKLPILVGGTGLYIKAVVDGIGTISIPQNNVLRKSLEDSNLESLYEKLAILDSAKAASLNQSDKLNPRRLIRAIEIAQWKMTHEDSLGGLNVNKNKTYDSLFIGLRQDKDQLLNSIAKRVENRMDQGFIFEIETLLRTGVSWKHQSMKSLGYAQAEDFLKKGLSYEEFINKWTNSEFRYAKRQLTWFKKEKRINWFDVDSNKYPQGVVNMVKIWHNKT